MACHAMASSRALVAPRRGLGRDWLATLEVRLALLHEGLGTLDGVLAAEGARRKHGLEREAIARVARIVDALAPPQRARPSRRTSREARSTKAC